MAGEDVKGEKSLRDRSHVSLPACCIVKQSRVCPPPTKYRIFFAGLYPLQGDSKKSGIGVSGLF